MTPPYPTRVAAAIGVLALACAEPAPPAAPPLPSADAVTLAEVGGIVTGAIAGEPFEAQDARFRVVTYAGRERVDLLFADRAIERCGLPIARQEARVWLRIPGVTALVPGELALLGEPDEDAPLELHYERPGAHGFVEAHRGVARLEITRASTARVEGRLHACFADAAESCVSGAFVATPCQSRIDGRALREPPGLADEALEPVPTPPSGAEPTP